MSHSTLHISGKTVRLHGASVSPDFRVQRVLCSDPWDYVYLWLKRHKQNDACFYWEQAKNFYLASKNLPPISSPLTSYYCFLNATKALLIAKSAAFTENHGVSGKTTTGHRVLSNEIITFQGAGILPGLCKLLDEPNNAGKEISLQNAFWNIPFIHRAYMLTYKSASELFIPLLDPVFVRKDKSKEAWFQAKIDRRYINAHTENVIKPGFELFKEQDNSYTIRRRRRFEWSGRQIEQSIAEFTKYHRTIRRRIIPIYASTNRWYLKKSISGHDLVSNSPLVLMYSSMHKLSELSRYNPIALSGHMDATHNWLLSEFLEMAPTQFIFGIASEITGMEFIKPDAF